MSELKAFVARKIDDGMCDPVPCVEVYLKSEADNVIAELKAQKAQAEDDCAYWKMREGNAVNAMHETEEHGGVGMCAWNYWRRRLDRGEIKPEDVPQKYEKCLNEWRIKNGNGTRI